MYKSLKWIFQFFIGISIILVIQCTAMFMVDPYQYFRKATFYKPIYKASAERFINPGIIKNFNYDSAIVGSSMTENFLSDQFKKALNWNTIKLSMQGATSFEISNIYKLLFKEGKVKNIITTLDFFTFDKGNNECTYEMPLYLYNSNPIDDIKYLLRFDLLKKEISDIYTYNYKVKENSYTDINYAYFWGYDATYSKTQVIKHFLEDMKLSKVEDAKMPANNSFVKEYYDNIISNFNEHLYKYILENPEVTFNIVLPPYSIVYMKSLQYKGVLDEHNECRKYIYNKLVKMPNVKLWDFQRDEIIIKNLDYYRDMVHYSYEINTYITYSMNDKHLLTKDNWEDAINKLNELIENYIIE